MGQNITGTILFFFAIRSFVSDMAKREQINAKNYLCMGACGCGYGACQAVAIISKCSRRDVIRHVLARLVTR